jgi:hypothetical protein
MAGDCRPYMCWARSEHLKCGMTCQLCSAKRPAVQRSELNYGPSISPERWSKWSMTCGGAAAADEFGLRRLARQLHAGRVRVKLFDQFLCGPAEPCVWAKCVAPATGSGARAAASR